MGANESLGVTPRLRDVDPALIWGLACTDSNAIKVDFSYNNARQCQFPNDWIFEADTHPLIDKQSGFILLFSKIRSIRTTSQYGNDTVKLTADIQAHTNSYLDVNTGRPSGLTQFSVLWGDHIFNVTGVSGTVYLWWANEISSYLRDPETGLVSPKIHKMHKGMPLLVHTDSHFQILHVCPLIVHENHVRFISCKRFKFPHKLAAWTPGFPHDTKPVHHSPRTLILSEVDVVARRDRQILPEGERRSFGIRHKVDRPNERRRRQRYDNSDYSNEEEDEDYDEGQGEISEATLIEELDPLGSNNMESNPALLADNVTSFFERALKNDDDDDVSSDPENVAAKDDDDDEEKTLGNNLEWDDDLLVKQQVTRMTLQSQIETDKRRQDTRRSHAKVISSTPSPPVNNNKGKEEEEEEKVEYEEGGQDLKFLGKTFESERMFKSAAPDDSAVSVVPLTSAQHGIAAHECGRSNHTYAPILRRGQPN